MANTLEQEKTLTIYLGHHFNWKKVSHDAGGNAIGENKQGIIVKVDPNGNLISRIEV